MKPAGLEADPARLPLTALRGVGPVKARRLERMGLSTVRDLLFLSPRALALQGGSVTAAAARDRVGAEVSVAGGLRSARIFRRGRRRSVVSAELFDDTGSIRVVFFNQPWLHERLTRLQEEGARVELYGRVVETRSGPALAAPRLGTGERPLPPPGTVLPVYPLTDGIGQEFLRGLCLSAVERFAEALPDPLPGAERARLDVPELGSALAGLHRPASAACFRRARRRVALERLLGLQARLERTRRASEAGSARPLRLSVAEREGLLERLPHRPTEAQQRVADEILSDLARTRPMRRLLQGDVGSGKTLVGLVGIAATAAAGGQSALLVPTEILAEQHYLGLAPWLRRAGIRTVLLSGSLPGSEQRSAREELASGRAQLAVGTHALFSADVSFARLDLALVDEQQRFGVEQKQALLDKGKNVHLLLMTATPIPRTLALCLYGDMETSVLDEAPPGRGGVKTRAVPAGRRARCQGFLAERMRAGERVYWVCPRIEAREDARAGVPDGAEAVFAAFSGGELGTFGVELVHGKVPAEERSRRIERFRTGVSRMLVGTSILEVGVDVPEATVMVIDGVEGFGLAQLHQLRGRIGRGPEPSWCLLFGGAAAEERMDVLAATDDGFAIAEEDLRRRGMGDLAGRRQAGQNVEGLLDPAVDADLVESARRLIRANAALAERYAAAAETLTPALV